MRGNAEIVEDKKGNFQIIITSIPFRVNKAELIIRIADLVRDKKLEGIRGLRDESTRDIRVVIDLKSGARPQSVLNYLELLLKPGTDFLHIQANYFDLMTQLPSLVIIAWMAAIYTSIFLEKYLSVGEMAPLVQIPSMRPQLADSRWPDVCVWAFIASLLGAFGNVQSLLLEGISANVLNICMVMFLFQGIAVVSKFFAGLRIGPFWKWLFIVLIVLQLFVLVCLIGLLDFWLGFRVRLAKRAEQLKRET